MLRKARGPFSLRALNIHSIAGGNYGKIENLSKSIFHLLMALSLTVSFCLGVNELKISFYETIHRESVQSILEFGFFSDWMDDIANLALIAFFVCLFLLE
ncbi:MAG: hypothetical protein ACUVQY_09025, partial [Thermoproteota archaeon]